MKKFVQKLDEATARRDFPIADLVEGWFFRCREVAVGGVYRVEGTDLWNTRIRAEGTDPEKLLRNCAESARGIDRHIKTILFEEYGTQLRLEGDELVLGVLCGGIGQFGVELVLNDSERERYKREGDAFIIELANLIRRNPDVPARTGHGRDTRRFRLMPSRTDSGSTSTVSTASGISWTGHTTGRSSFRN
jgi:hypothetical protein